MKKRPDVPTEDFLDKTDISTSIQSPDQMSSKFIDRFIRLKTPYWNRGFSIVILTFNNLKCHITKIPRIKSVQSPNCCFLLFRLFRYCSNTALRSSGISLRRSIISDFPWKSFCTSMPVIAIFLSYFCDILKDYNYYEQIELDQPLRKHTTIFLSLLFVLVELVPGITVYFSVTNVRKLLSCTISIAMSIIFVLEAFKVKIVLFL
ncbi:uncharacterized protein LOC132951336 [Metopolophium dirhodum]|uniref:uncharacterized protein LOC132951336 n=1 Tax=Metopolophium dirhodum TaxID=44670 RepID=UPI00298F4F1C|nr:uncharacterized protein LOC132951336 [Metopolophium dirhodum]